MCIYCTTKNYRKIYENHYGEIPKDANGRRYDIHHIDGNHTNNNPVNLTAVTIQEHYDIHYARGEYGSCFKMAYRMNLTPEELSALARQANKERVARGEHHFLGGEVNRKRFENGTHGWITSSKNRVKNRTHNFLGKNNNRSRLESGTHNSQIKACCLKCKKEVSSNNVGQHANKCSSQFNT